MRLILSWRELGRSGLLLQPSLPWARVSHNNSCCSYSSITTPEANSSAPELIVAGRGYARDDFTNVTPRILSHLGRNLHLRPHHPLGSVFIILCIQICIGTSLTTASFRVSVEYFLHSNLYIRGVYNCIYLFPPPPSLF
jgi:hypothetical protein